jgi:hypothetical protein
MTRLYCRVLLLRENETALKHVIESRQIVPTNWLVGAIVPLSLWEFKNVKVKSKYYGERADTHLGKSLFEALDQDCMRLSQIGGKSLSAILFCAGGRQLRLNPANISKTGCV